MLTYCSMKLKHAVPESSAKASSLRPHPAQKKDRTLNVIYWILNSSTAGHHGWHHCHPWPYVFFSVHVRKESEETLGLGRHFGCLSVLSLSGEPSPGAEHVCLALFVHLRGRHWRTKPEDGLWLLMWKWHDMWEGRTMAWWRDFMAKLTLLRYLPHH